MVKSWSKSWPLSTPPATGSHHISLREVPVFNARINNAPDHGCNWNDGDILYSELETLLQREASSAVAIYCFGPQKSAFLSNLIDRTAIDITQLICPQLADMSSYHQLHVCLSQQV